MRVLLTRPEVSATATAAALRRLGHEPVLAPCLVISPRAAALPALAAALILTSAQAVPALPARYAALPAFCVGDATAARLREAGFSNVSSAAADADALFHLVTARRLPGLHLLAVGARQGAPLAARLRAASIAVSRRVVYAATPAGSLPGPARAALAGGDIDAALFYSAETAVAFRRLAPPGTATVVAGALSPAVAAALTGLPWRAIRVAVAPNEPDLLALLND